MLSNGEILNYNFLLKFWKLLFFFQNAPFSIKMVDTHVLTEALRILMVILTHDLHIWSEAQPFTISNLLKIMVFDWNSYQTPLKASTNATFWHADGDILTMIPWDRCSSCKISISLCFSGCTVTAPWADVICCRSRKDVCLTMTEIRKYK